MKIYCSESTVHDSMGLGKNRITELRGVKVGQQWKGRKIKHITPAGEAIFANGEWEYVDRVNSSNPDL